MKKTKLFLLMSLLLFGVTQMMGAEAYAVLSGSTLTFSYGTKPSGAYAMNSGTSGPGWSSKATSVTKVVFESSFASARPKSCRQWFYGMTNLTTITGSDYLNTSETTDMYAMFYNCSSLTAVSVGKWSTGQVTNMQSMFYGCAKLTTLAVSSWNTANVTSMANMFYNCSGLKSLDLSGWNTAKVTSMATLFYNCTSLTSLNVKGWDTAKATNLSYMFYGCTGLKSLDLSTFSIASTSVTTTTMLYLKNLTSLTISSSFNNLDAAACQGVGSKTAPCALVYPSGFTPTKTSTGTGWYQWKGGYFKDGGTTPTGTAEAYAVLSGSTLTFYYDAQSGSRSGTVYEIDSRTYAPDWHANASSITKVVFNSTFDNAAPTTCYAWFYQMSKLTTITGLEYLHTDDVTNMSYMFSGCSSLTRLNLGTFDTSSVTNMSYMFSGCSKLDILTLAYAESPSPYGFTYFETYFDTKSVTNMRNMFSGCSSLTSLALPSFQVTSSKNTTDMFKGCSGLLQLFIDTDLNSLNAAAFSGVGTATSPCQIFYTSVRPEPSSIAPTYFVWKGGYFTTSDIGYAELSKDGKTLTFKYGIYDDLSWGGDDVALDLYHLNEGEGEPGWFEKASGVTKVVFEEGFKYVRPTSTYMWFSAMKKLTSIEGFKYLNTEYVTEMGYMFSSATKLTSLDLSNMQLAYTLESGGVTDEIVLHCDRLLYGCSSLKTLTIPKIVTISIGSVFDPDANKSIELYGDVSPNLLPEDACKGVGTASAPCTLVYPSGFTPEKSSTGSGWYMWKGGYFKNSGTTTETKAYAVLSGSTLTFYFDAQSGSRSGTVYDLNSGSTTPAWNAKASTVTKVVFNSTFDKAAPTTCYAWFYQMTGLTTITGIEYLHTDKATNLAYMFAGCSKLSELNLGTFDTKNVTTMYRMFYNCSALKDLYLYKEAYGMGEYVDYESTFVTDKATTLQEMFSGCSSLTELVLANFKVTSSTNTTNMLKGCAALQELSFDQDMGGLNANACSGVGTASKPCALVNPHYIAQPTQTTPTYMVWKSGYFIEGLRCAIVYLDDDVLTFDYGILYLNSHDYETTQLNTGSKAPGWYDEVSAKVTTVVFTENFKYVRPTSTHLWFGSMSGLTKIEGLKYLNTEYVTDMGYMFSGVKKLTSLDLSTFTIGSSANSKLMLNGCSGLKTLTVPSSAGYLSSDACKGVGTTSAPCTLNYPSGFTPEKTATGSGWFQWKTGYFKDTGTTPTPTTGTPYAVLSGSTLTFYCNDNKPSGAYAMNTGTSGPGWYSKASTVTKVVFDASFANARPKSCRQWFYNMTNLTTITGSDYLNTSETTDMYSMFYNCSALTAVSVGKWDTGQVTNMQSMFYGCAKLTALAVSGWNTANVTTMANMFYNCADLKTLDLSGWNTAKVTTMYTMFYGCSSLTSLNVKGWNTAKVTEFSYMFYNCSGLTSLNLSTFTIASTSVKTTTMLYAKGLKNLYISSSFNNLDAAACQGVGTKTAPCALSYPSGFTPQKTSTGSGWYQWKGGYFVDGAEETFAKGDVNHDGTVDVLDVMLVVDYTLHKDNAQFHFNEADVNDDGKPDVTDIMLIVDMTLHKDANISSLYLFSAADRMSLSGQAGVCTLRLDGPGAFTACQFSLTLPQGCALLDAEMAGTFGGSHQVLTQDMGNGRYNVVVFSTSGELLGHGQLLRFNLSGNYARGIHVGDILMCDPACEGVTLESVNGITTGIDGVNADGTYDDLYNIQGMGVKRPQRGVYIRNGRKVVVK